jgi:phage shock protein A
MGVITRIVRIFKADIHGVMDQLEDKELLLKQHLRDMEAALVQKEARLRQMKSVRKQMGHEHQKYVSDIQKLEQDLRVAIKKDKDDIARMLIKKLKPLSGLRDDLQNQMDALDQEIDGFKDSISRQRMQYDQLRHRSIEFFYRVEQNEWERVNSKYFSENSHEQLSDQEIELELLRRKEAFSSNISQNISKGGIKQ